MIGLPQNGLIFFRGMRLLPPRAGIIASLMSAVPFAETLRPWFVARPFLRPDLHRMRRLVKRRVQEFAAAAADRTRHVLARLGEAA
jgi:hypothetical protein